MSKSAFEVRVTTWLREKRDVELAPPDPGAERRGPDPGAERRGPDPGAERRGPDPGAERRGMDPGATDDMRFGEMKMPSDAGHWGFRGLLLVAISAVLSLVASRPGIGILTERSMTWAAVGALVLGIASLVLAAMRRVPSRAICVIFVPTGKAREATQVEAMKRASTTAGTTEIWLVSDAPWARAALELAADVVCFEPRGRDFVEVTRSRTTGAERP